MSKTLTWLMAGAVLSLTVGASIALAETPEEAARQAAERARAAASEARERAKEAKEAARREIHVHYGPGAREDRLRTMLQLRPNQESALQAYLEAVGKGEGRDHFVRFDRRSDARTTAERLAEMEAKMAEQQAAMKRRIDATKAFYAQLDEKQRKVFDAMPMLMFAGPGFGPMLMPVMHHMPLPPEPPPPVPPRL